jgi:hypothetical protein
VRAIRTVPRFERAADEVAPAQATQGNKASARQLRLAAAALETVGDVISRFYVTFGIGSGLRGGEFTYEITDDGYDFDLNRVLWTEDLEVSGTIRWNQNTDEIVADVRLFQDGARIGRLDIHWDDAQRNAIATMSGTIGGSHVEAKRIAP